MMRAVSRPMFVRLAITVFRCDETINPIRRRNSTETNEEIKKKKKKTDGENGRRTERRRRHRAHGKRVEYFVV